MASFETIISIEIADKIDSDDYKYYWLPERVKPWTELYSFYPDENTIIFDKGTKNWQRLIFPESEDSYNDFEIQKYQEFMKFVEEKKISKIRNRSTFVSR